MPSILLGNPVASGPQILTSGWPYSGVTPYVITDGVFLKLPSSASGNVYVGTSGNVTFLSGGFFMSGGGNNDGYPLLPGDEYFIPKSKFPLSGQLNVYVWADAGCSGVTRLFYDLR